jgi:signal transduction histidine kinase
MLNPMRLADFILSNTEQILEEWEVFARSIWPREVAVDVAELRDHAQAILLATVTDMNSAQSGFEQSEKSMGRGSAGVYSDRLDSASAEHGVGRVASGFNLLALVSEYRALRASVMRLWRQSKPDADSHDLDDITRFDESIDQSLTEAIASFTTRVDQARRMFLAILGHDLRNPLGAVSMGAKFIATESDDAEAKAVATQIASSASMMEKMIHDLLDFTLAGLGGGMPTSPAPVDAGEVCQQVITEMRQAFPARNLSIKTLGNLEATADAARLRQLVSNLVANALQHGAEGGPVSVVVSDQGAVIQIAVHNQGPPIAPAKLPTLFDPLVRGSSRKAGPAKQQSIGLGLYIAKEVAKAHGGNIDVQSTAPAGTTFTARLLRHTTGHANG